MSFFQLAKARYSVRSFDSRAIEPAIVTRVLEAGRIAPTACNNQPQRLKVITGTAALAQLDKCTPCRFNAPAAVLVCYDKTVCWQRPFDNAASGETDAAIVTTHLMLAAQEAGLGSCWVMHFDPAKIIEQFALPANIIPAALLLLGYPAKDAVPADRHEQRASLSDMLI